LIDVRVRLRTRRNQIPVSVDVNEREAYGLPMLGMVEHNAKKAIAVLTSEQEVMF
jgi:hypothetical protein